MYYKFLDGNKSPVSSVLKELGFNDNAFTFEIDKINVCENFDETQMHGGGFYFLDEENILNFLGYGMTVYDVVIPNDANVIQFVDDVLEYKTDKIIITNPRKVDKEFVEEMLTKGKISNKKIVGVIGDLIKKDENELAELVFGKIEPNDIDVADAIINSKISEEFPKTYIEIYSKTTSPAVITFLYNAARYKQKYEHMTTSLEANILGRISKNIDRPIKEIVDKYINDEIDFSR